MSVKNLMMIIIGLIFLSILIGYPILLKSTTTSLQENAIDVGEIAKTQVTTDIEITQIFAYDASDGKLNGGTDNLTLMVRTGSGSGSIDLNDLLIKIDSTDVQTSLSYTFGDNKISGNTFGVSYLLNSSQGIYGYITQGDIAQLVLTIPDDVDITEGSRMIIRVVPINGIVKTIDLTLPQQLSSNRITLY